MTESRTAFDVAVVGAGIAGLCAAGELVAAGRSVLVLEKSRGVGGRMATRRIGEAVFDHGAQFFTIRGRAFGNVVGEAQRAGAVEKWCEEFPRVRSAIDGPDALSPPDQADRAARWRGTRGMTDLPKRVVESIRSAVSDGGGFELRPATRVLAIVPEADRVRVEIEAHAAIHARAAVVAIPAPQAIDLFGPGRDPAAGARGFDGDAVAQLQRIEYDPCFAAMLVLDRPSLLPPPGGVRCEEGPIAWIADNHLKGISGVPAITIHASADFSRACFDDPPETVVERLVAAAAPWIDGDPATAVRERSLHRWKFSLVARGASSPMVAVSTAPPVVCCGDGFGGGRVEGAASSGLAAGRWIGRVLASQAGS